MFANINYMSIAVSILTTISVTPNSYFTARQERSPYSELNIIPSIMGNAKNMKLNAKNE
jgi:hypothetical protein